MDERQELSQDEKWELAFLRNKYTEHLKAFTQVRNESFGMGKAIGKMDGWLLGYLGGLMTFAIPIAAVFLLKRLGLI